MYKLYCSLLLLSVFNCYGQQKAPAPLETKNYYETYVQGKQPPVIKGIIRNIPDAVKRSSATLVVAFFTLDVDGEYTRSIKLSPNGSFEIKPEHGFPIQKLGLDIYELPRKYIYVSKDLFIDIDYRLLEKNSHGAVAYKGVDTRLNSYVDEYNWFYNNHNSRLSAEAGQLEADTSLKVFLSHWAMFNKDADSINALFFAGHKADDQYQWVIKNDLLAKRYQKLLEFKRGAGIELSADELSLVNDYHLYFQSTATHDFYYALNKCAAISRPQRVHQTYLESLFKSLLANKETAEADKNLIKHLQLATRTFYFNEQTGTSSQAAADSLSKLVEPILKKYETVIKAFTKDFDARASRISYADYLKSLFTPQRADILMAFDLPNQQQVGIDKFNMYYQKAIPKFTTTLAKTQVTAYAKRINALPGNTRILKTAVISNGTDSKHYTYHKIALANNLTLYSNNKIDGVTLFKQLAQQNKNKVMFIDMWGTWCQACLDNFPKSELLRSKTDANKVVFVYLCNTSEQKDCMVDMVKFRLNGINVFLSHDQTKQLESLFKVTGYPTYILVDKKGNIQYDAKQYVDDPEKGSVGLNLMAAK